MSEPNLVILLFGGILFFSFVVLKIFVGTFKVLTGVGVQLWVMQRHMIHLNMLSTRGEH